MNKTNRWCTVPKTKENINLMTNIKEVLILNTNEILRGTMFLSLRRTIFLTQAKSIKKMNENVLAGHVNPDCKKSKFLTLREEINT